MPKYIEGFTDSLQSGEYLPGPYAGSLPQKDPLAGLEIQQAPEGAFEAEPGTGSKAAQFIASNLAGTADAILSTAAGMAAWPVGKAIGVSHLLAGKSAEQARHAEEAFTSKMPMPGELQDMISNPNSPFYISSLFAGEGGRAAGETLAKGLDLALGAARQVANVEGDLYKPLGMQPIKKSFPKIGYVAEIGVDLMMFKAAHSTAKNVANVYRARAERLRKIKDKSFENLTREDIETLKTINEETTALTPDEVKLLDSRYNELQIEYKPQRQLEAPQKQLEAPTSVAKINKETPTTKIEITREGKGKYRSEQGDFIIKEDGVWNVYDSERSLIIEGKKSLRDAKNELQELETPDYAKTQQKVVEQYGDKPTRSTTPESAEAELREMVPEVMEYIQDPTKDISRVESRVQQIVNDLDPANPLHSEVVSAGEKMLVEINRTRRESPVEAAKTAPKEEFSFISDEAKQRIRDEIEAAKEGRSETVTAEEAVKRTEAELEGPKEKKPVKTQDVKFTKEEAGRYSNEDGSVVIEKVGSKWYLDEGGTKIGEEFKTLRDAKKAYNDRVKSGEVKAEPKPDAEFTMDDLRETFREFNEKQYKAKTAKEELTPEQYEKILEKEGMGLEKFEDPASLKADEFGEYVQYNDKMTGDWQIDTQYGARDFAKDAFDSIWRSDETGAVGDLGKRRISARQAAALDRMFRKAKQMGRDFRAMLEELGLDEKTIKNIERLVEETYTQEQKRKADPNSFNVHKKVDPNTLNDATVLRQEPGRRYRGADIENVAVTYRDLKAIKEAIKKYPSYLTGEIGKKFETAARTFSRMPLLKEILHRPYQAAEKSIAVFLDRLEKDIRPLEKSLTRNQKERIGQYAIAQQEGGIALLQESGVKQIPKLTAKEFEAYDFLRQKYDEMFSGVNNVRVKIGKAPIKGIDNYFTFMRVFDFWEKAGLKFNSVFESSSHIKSEYIRAKSAPFRYGKMRKKGVKMKVETDPFKIFRSYSRAAADHIYLSPVVAKARQITAPIKDPLTNKFVDIRHQKPELSQFVQEWANHVAGVDVKRAPWVVRKLQGNIAISALGANLRSAAIQTTALRNTIAEIGVNNTLKGTADLFKPSEYRAAMEKSNVLFPRNFDATIVEALGGAKNWKVGDAWKVFQRGSFIPLKTLDMLSARATWSGAYRHAKTRFKMREDAAIKYADDVVTKTQASGMKGDIAPIQRSAVGKILTMFQTFVINDWQFLVHDVLGFGKNAKLKTVMPKVVRYGLATIMFNYLYEDLLNIKSPFPRPINALLKGLDENKRPFRLAIDTGKELIEPIPVIGNARYGKAPFGPLVEYGSEIVTGGKYGITPAKEIDMYLDKGRVPAKTIELAGRAAGVPGTAQLAKMARARKRGESLYDTILGNYTEKDSRSSSRTRKRRSRLERR